jgi:hypothetical protein
VPLRCPRPFLTSPRQPGKVSQFPALSATSHLPPSRNWTRSQCVDLRFDSPRRLQRFALVSASFPSVRPLRPPAPRPRMARDAPEPIGSVPKLAVDQVTVQIHRHRRARMPQHPLDDLGTPRR